MKNFFRVIVTLLLLGGWTMAALALHVVRYTRVDGGERWLIVPKSRLAISQTYVDVRGWGGADVSANPTLVRRLIAAEKSEALASIVPESERGSLVQTLESWLAHPPAPPATQPQ